MRRLIPLLFLVTATGTATAQARPGAAAAAPAPGAPTVSGTVFDSLHGVRLRGATIVVDGVAFTTMSDSTGHYTIPLDSIGAGTRRFTFFHPALDTIGIAAPPRTVVLEKGMSAIVDLAVPSGRTIIDAFCQASPPGGDRTLIMGDVRDADEDKPLAGALVVVQWSAMTLGNSTISKLPQAASVFADSSGQFRICGVPAGVALRAQARKRPKSSGFIDLQLDQDGVVVQEFLVGDRPAQSVAAAPAGGAGAAGAAGATAAQAPAGDPNAPLGKAVLTGNVTGGDGKPLEGAQVLLVGTTRSTRADYKGNFRMTGLPAGTQKVEVRLLSYQLKSYVVNLSAVREAHLNAVLDTRAQVLDPVITTATTTTDIPGFDQRMAGGVGTFFTKKQIDLLSPQTITDIFRQVAGMKVMFSNGQYIVVANRANQTCQTAQWYVDGSPYTMNESDNPDELFLPSEVEAIEVYNSATSTPPQFMGSQSACGTIVVWTVRGHFKPKKKAPSDTAKSN
jgi:hypothetical protein